MVGLIKVSETVEAITVAAMEAKEVERQAAAAALRADFEVTGGIDLQKLTGSYLVTPRGSARLAQSEAVLIDNAWTRIKAASGCDPIQTVILPEVPGPHSWDPPIAPKAYLIGIKC